MEFMEVYGEWSLWRFMEVKREWRFMEVKGECSLWRLMENGG